VDHVPDSLLLRKSGRAGNRTWISGSVARNSDHQTTEAVCEMYTMFKTFSLTGTVQFVLVSPIGNYEYMKPTDLKPLNVTFGGSRWG
jgi:hypothetical protein